MDMPVFANQEEITNDRHMIQFRGRAMDNKGGNKERERQREREREKERDRQRERQREREREREREDRETIQSI